MSDPYEILGLPRHADEAEVRRRYLELVRRSPPDRDPERFAALRDAYEAARDPLRRIEDRIFEPPTGDSLESIAAEVRARLRDRLDGVPVDILLSLARPR